MPQMMPQMNNKLGVGHALHRWIHVMCDRSHPVMWVNMIMIMTFIRQNIHLGMCVCLLFYIYVLCACSILSIYLYIVLCLYIYFY